MDQRADVDCIRGTDHDVFAARAQSVSGRHRRDATAARMTGDHQATGDAAAEQLPVVQSLFGSDVVIEPV
jgi:hypothetical protein